MLKFLLKLVCFYTIAFSVNISFNIDMNEMPLPNEGFEDIVINGSWNNWSGWGVTLSDNDGDGIFQGSIDLDNGVYQYVVAATGIADNWSGWGHIINPPLGSICDWNPNDEWANYGFNVDNSNVIESFCAGTCLEVCTNNNDGDDDNHYTLVWSDEFDGPNIDDSKWNFEIGTGNWGWGNGEHQYYTDRQENTFIEDGKLIIQALSENYAGSNYTSARLTTKNKGDWTYGKIEGKIKVPNAGGTWPAFWMMPTDSFYGTWPNSGEIDIMEHYGCDTNYVHATVHNNIYNWNEGIPPISYTTYTNATSDFHIYEVEWDENELRFYVDSEYLGTYSKTDSGWQQWPYDQNFYIILNLAISSHFMTCSTEDNLFPQKLEIDYIRVYQKQECSTLGDISNDDSIDIIDVVQLVSIIVENENSNPNPCHDLNEDGILNVIDIVMLVNLIIN